MATFISKHHSLRLIRRNAIRRPSEYGVDTIPEQVVEFEAGGGTFTVNEDGTWSPDAGYRNGDWILPDGENGTDQTLLEWLRNHRDAGVLFHEEQMPTPEPTIELRELATLAASQDVDGIVALGERENRTFQRPEVFEALDEALAAIGKVAPKKVAHLLPEPEPAA